MIGTINAQPTLKTRPIRLAPDLEIGGDQVVIMAGPCSVETYEQTRTVAQAVAQAGIRVLRGGAYKPRTSPGSFQGLGAEGLRILRQVADEFGLLVVTEALGVEHVPLVAEMADIIQIGSRNMQHTPLLWEVGKLNKPVLLKRGFMSTIQEWLAAAEHIHSRGNDQIILCERGIRTFDTATRNTLDAVAIALVKQETPYPVIGDPSHAAGRSDLVIPASRVALAAGADGLLVEFHPDPTQAWSDGFQALSLDQLPGFVWEVEKITQAMGRTLEKR